MNKFVVRLLTAEGELLAWSEVRGVPSVGSLTAPGPVRLIVERDGVATHVSVAWCDLSVARLEPVFIETQVYAGQALDYHFRGPLWAVPGEANVPLPPVTVREPVTLAPATGPINAFVPV